MDFERVENRRKGCCISCCDGYMYSKNNQNILVDSDVFLKFGLYSRFQISFRFVYIHVFLKFFSVFETLEIFH